MKIGRNDPCPCGSGRKYKQCCLLLQIAIAPEEDTWRRLRRLLSDFNAKLGRFSESAYGEYSLIEAWQQFALYDEDRAPPDLDDPDLACFLSWFNYHYGPVPEETQVTDVTLYGLPPALAFLRRRPREIDPLLKEYIEAALNSPFSYYSVAACRPGHSLQLIDLFTEEAHEVREEKASQDLTEGDVIFASLVDVSGVCLMEACAGLVLAPQDSLPLIDMREQMLAEKHAAGVGGPLTRQDVYCREFDLREFYLNWSEQVLNGPPPQIQNSDGDPISPQTLIYQVPSAQAAFDALKHLDPDSEDCNQPRSEQYDEAGRLTAGMLAVVRAPLGGSAADEEVVTATIMLADSELRVEVNSDRRAKEIQKQIRRALGKDAKFLRTEYPDAADEVDDEEFAAMSDLLQSAETDQVAEELLRRHYSQWPDDRLPALQGQTPRQAVRTRGGRAKVEALLSQFERSSRGAFTGPMPELLDEIRRSLGLK